MRLAGTEFLCGPSSQCPGLARRGQRPAKRRKNNEFGKAIFWFKKTYPGVGDLLSAPLRKLLVLENDPSAQLVRGRKLLILIMNNAMYFFIFLYFFFVLWGKSEKFNHRLVLLDGSRDQHITKDLLES